MKKILQSKSFWIFMTILALLLMVIGFFTKDLGMWISAFIISILIRIYAKDILFIDPKLGK
ncbi:MULTISPECIES: hypothetical protein [unclassified Oceanobacillus]|uniref:hypothetical protein n=1 Tax=unclassified Oceanobacillus TaxID=2630292 RepID=UPI00300E06B4